MTGIEALEEFLLNLKLYNDRDEKTIKAYRADVKEGIRYFYLKKKLYNGKNLIKYFLQISQEKWLILLKEKGMKAATINIKRASFKLIVVSLELKVKLKINPVS
ncbi:hypothetical protein RHK18_18440 [Clostridioides difficile]|nr:hypothetical protein [Clostridioides difficile]